MEVLRVKKIPFSSPKSTQNQLFSHYFSKVKDPRRTNRGHFLYPLDEILFLCITAVLSGMDDWTSISMFGRSKQEWLRQYYPYRHGVPSHDVLGKVFSALDPERFSVAFSTWTGSLAELTGASESLSEVHNGKKRMPRDIKRGTMKYDVPEFSKLTELIAEEVLMHDRALFFHWPSNTVMELLPDLEEHIMSYDGPKFHWERQGPDDVIHRALFVVHRTILENGTELREVIEKAKQWYGHF